MQRKKYTAEFKAQVIKEALETGNNSVVARRYELNSNMVSRWVREAKNNSPIGLGGSIEQLHGSLEAKQAAVENEQFKKLLGEKELENQILRDLLKKTNPHALKRLK
ncbi:transposase [Petroclostridium xylanilyticum]|uniref:transposase n=1 Tax=Petroclostridium xylanilyticum TaxID=1792311 RepID=UPI000B99A116|nr:transposase [Petroclostridium xylanilyticum]